MNGWKFFHEHYILAFFALCFVYGILHSVIYYVLVILPNRILRHWNIRKHGYPPDHCDADGDFRTQQKGETND